MGRAGYALFCNACIYRIKRVGAYVEDAQTACAVMICGLAVSWTKKFEEMPWYSD
jgi:hypothetical protein